MNTMIKNFLKTFIGNKVTVEIKTSYANALLFLMVEDVVIEDGLIVFEVEHGSNISISLASAQIYTSHIVSGDNTIKICL